MSTGTFLYPNTTPSGQYVPDAIINPTASYIMPFTTAALGAVATLFAATDDFHLVQLFATEDCQIGFTNTPIGVPASNVKIVDSMILFANNLYQINLPSLYLSAIGLTASGILYANLLNPWNALGTQVQLNRL
jgi:hypothetical protein